MHSLFLDPDKWDLFVDKNGKIANCYAEYAIAQNVANACRLFIKDAYYDEERGIPHFALELKEQPSIDILKNRLRDAALEVKGVADAQVNHLTTTDRMLVCQMLIQLNDGTMINVAI